MNIRESIGMSLSAIRANKLRTGLTLLSISIGVFAIVGVAAAVGALNSKVEDQLASLGRNSFIITRIPAMSFGNNWRKYMNRKQITLRQAMELKSRLTSAEFVGMSNQVAGAVVKYGDESTDPNVTVIGTDEVYVANSDYTVAEGRGLDASDVQTASDVAVIGGDIAQKVFKNTSPVGKSIAVNGHRYAVIGVLQSKGAIFGQSMDNFIAVPITSAIKYFFDEWDMSLTLFIRAKSSDVLQETVDQAVGLLRIIRRVGLSEDNDFEVSTNESLSETFGGFTGYVSMFGLFCGAFALVAAGVGIMNIMLVSVKERTREIGVRKAIGATRWNIMSQFVIEAITICQVGAMIGVLLGIGGGAAMSAVLGASVPVPWNWIGIAFGACLLIGIVFGSYPAWKASRLDPIDALRYE